MILNENWLILGGSPKEYEVTMKWLRHRCITGQTLLTRNAFTEPHNHQVVSNSTNFRHSQSQLHPKWPDGGCSDIFVGFLQDNLEN